METSSKTCVAVDTEQATLFVALELSQATWLVGLHSPIADKISINRIDGGDTDKLLALIEKKRESHVAAPACPSLPPCSDLSRTRPSRARKCASLTGPARVGVRQAWAGAKKRASQAEQRN